MKDKTKMKLAADADKCLPLFLLVYDYEKTELQLITNLPPDLLVHMRIVHAVEESKYWGVVLQANNPILQPKLRAKDVPGYRGQYKELHFSELEVWLNAIELR